MIFLKSNLHILSSKFLKKRKNSKSPFFNKIIYKNYFKLFIFRFSNSMVEQKDHEQIEFTKKLARIGKIS